VCVCVSFIHRILVYSGCSTFILYYYYYYYHYYHYYCRHHYRSRQIDRRRQMYITTGNEFIFSILPITWRHKRIMFFVWTEQNENYYIVACRVSVTSANNLYFLGAAGRKTFTWIDLNSQNVLTSLAHTLSLSHPISLFIFFSHLCWFWPFLNDSRNHKNVILHGTYILY